MPDEQAGSKLVFRHVKPIYQYLPAGGNFSERHCKIL